jgi:acyl-coenzyme A synthetase/AMP-(fatty) acid ligase
VYDRIMAERNPEKALHRLAVAAPNAIAYLDPRRTVTYHQLDDLVRRAGLFLSRHRIEPWAPIATLFDDQLLCLTFSLAFIRFGHPQLALQPLQNRHALEAALKAAAAGHIITNQVVKDVPRLSVHRIAGLQELAATDPGSSPGPVAEWPEALPIFCFLGSGTTDEPKLIAHSARGLFAMIGRDLSARPIGERDRHLSMSRLSYFTALRRSLAALTAFGVIVTVDQRTAPKQILTLCQRYRIDHLSMVQVHAESLFRACPNKAPALPDLKSLIIGSSPISQKTRERIQNLLSPNLVIGYGTNEFGEATVLRCSTQSSGKADSVGFPCSGVEVRIVDASGAPLPIGTTGGIELRSEVPFFGYLGAAETQSRGTATDWLKTGDLGRLTEEGELLFAGRQDDLMIFNGINIYPREIESVLERHPMIAEAAALAVPSEQHGDIPVAFVVCHGAEVDSKQLLAYVGSNLGTKAPKRIYVLPKLPRNAAGKVLKRQLRGSIRPEAPHQ